MRSLACVSTFVPGEPSVRLVEGYFPSPHASWMIVRTIRTTTSTVRIVHGKIFLSKKNPRYMMRLSSASLRIPSSSFPFQPLHRTPDQLSRALNPSFSQPLGHP